MLCAFLFFFILNPISVVFFFFFLGSFSEMSLGNLYNDNVCRLAQKAGIFVKKSYYGFGEDLC